MDDEPELKFYAYVSRAKVHQLHEQLCNVTFTEVSEKKNVVGSGEINAEAGGLFGFLKGGLKATGSRTSEVEKKGTQSTVQKLNDVLGHIARNENVGDLNALCRAKAGKRLDAFAYTYEGKFSVLADVSREHSESSSIRLHERTLEQAGEITLSQEGLISPARAENAYAERGPNNSWLVSDICLIVSACEGFRILLSCSYKYFTDMGGSWQEEAGEWSVQPHSGNYTFFEGETDNWFRLTMFITEVKGNTIMGTSLFLVHGIDPSATI